ncbi:PTS glucose transporter subunit IIA [Dellaglioa algida]|nr:PTS glucose transporter subunit IIA [Dellaglioa algida]MDK1726571.1 PTS glucose transporter subunit IIA [Dellaglioa algida]
MSIFRRKQKINDDKLYAPATGSLISLEDVSDSVFAQKLMGDGFGFKPTTGNIYSPVSGTVTLVASTKHALGFTMDNGLEVLLHMGVDTVELNGAPFDINIKKGARVHGGELLGTMNLAQVAEVKLDDVLIVVITNTSDQLDQLTLPEPQVFDGGTELGSGTAKGEN